MYTCYKSQLGVHTWVTSVTWDFDRLWTLLEDACTELDLRMAEVNHGEGGVGSGSFIEYSIALQQRSALKSHLESRMAHVTLLEQLATFLAVSSADPEGSEPLRAMRSEASIARCRAEQMVMCTNICTLQCSFTLITVFQIVHIGDYTE